MDGRRGQPLRERRGVKEAAGTPTAETGDRQPKVAGDDPGPRRMSSQPREVGERGAVKEGTVKSEIVSREFGPLTLSSYQVKPMNAAFLTKMASSLFQEAVVSSEPWDVSRE